MDEQDREGAKRRAGESAAATVEDGDVVGLGSGSTAAHAIRAIGRDTGPSLDVRGVPTSYQAREVAIEAGIELTTLGETGGHVDVAIDGADQVAGGDLVKGGGASHAREKVVALAADRFLVVVDRAKQAEALDHPIPVEVLPTARATVEIAVKDLGGEPTLRQAAHKSGPVVTDNGNVVLDCDFGRIDQLAALATDLTELPGVVEHGLFVAAADAIHVGGPDVTVERP